MRALLLALLLTAAPLAGAGSGDPPQSIYNLSAKLVDQSGAARGLDVHRGHPVLVTMFYGSCGVACPLLIDTLRSFDRSLTPAERARIRVVLISIDPEHDTTENLQKLATARRIDLSRWTLVHTDEPTVRKIAAGVMLAFGAGTLPAMLIGSVAATHLTRAIAARGGRQLSGAILLLFGLWLAWAALPSRSHVHHAAGQVAVEMRD